MTKRLTADEVSRYRRDGFHFPIRVLSAGEAHACRDRLEAHERATGGPIAGNMRHKVHLLFTWAHELARHPAILDAVEDIIGPDILCWSSTFFIKEARSPSFVSWHQDATYWGLSTDEVVTAWVAFADAPVESGAMRFWPGSHLRNQLEHRDTFDENNLLSRGRRTAQGRRDVAAPRSAGPRVGAEHDR
jgi:non-haem Fe2+, alpha-ketoglutarate-dependent halogenase